MIDGRLVVTDLFQSLRGVLVGFRVPVPSLANAVYVSIPKRGFGGFSPCTVSLFVYISRLVSIPKRGFGGFSLLVSLANVRPSGEFQSLRGVLVGFRRYGWFGC